MIMDHVMGFSMQMRKMLFRLLTGSVALLVLAGCESYQNPPMDFDADAYTTRDRGAADELLKGVTELSLEKAQQIALANNPTYIAAYYSLAQAKMRYYQALGGYAPTISAGASIARMDSYHRGIENVNTSRHVDGWSGQVTASINWTLFDGLAREFQVKISEHAYNQQQRLSEDDARQLLRSVAYAYNEVMLAKEKIRIANEDWDFQVKNLGYTELKLEVGAVPLSDVLNFRVQANSALGNKIAAEYNYQIALNALAVMMGYPEGTLPPEVVFPDVTAQRLSTLPPVELYLDNALANRPDLQAYREQVQIAEYQRLQSFSNFSPVISAFAQYQFSPYSNRYHYGDGAAYTSRDNGNTFNYGVQANWTLFSGFIRYNRVREMEAALAATRFQVANQWLAVVQEVRNAYANYTQNVKQVRLYEETLAITTKQRDLVDEQYHTGNVALTRLNEVQRDLVDAQTTLASAYVGLRNAKAQLDAAAAMNVADYGVMPEMAAEAAPLEVTGFDPQSGLRRAVPEVKDVKLPDIQFDSDGIPVWDPNHTGY